MSPAASPAASLERVRRACLRVSAGALGALLAALVALDFAQVLMRYALGRGWPWAGDVSIILLLSLAWLGAAHLWLDRGHIAVALVPVGTGLHRVLSTLWSFAALAGAVALAPHLIDTISAYAMIDLPALALPASAKYLPVAAGLALLVAAAALDLVRLWHERPGRAGRP